jgi:hypothetical protein
VQVELISAASTVVAATSRTETVGVETEEAAEAVSVVEREEGNFIFFKHLQLLLSYIYDLNAFSQYKCFLNFQHFD